MKSKIVIFGATGGMGSAIARRLAGEGYGLHLIAREQVALSSLESEQDGVWTARRPACASRAELS